MMQAKRWEQLIKPGITAIVGAGGKSTVLRKLVEYGRLSGMPTVVTTTTKLYKTQVADWNPYIGEDFNDAEAHCMQAICQGRCGAWFSHEEGTKVTALSTRQIDDLHRVHPDWHIVVEADGAKEKWLKAPKETEPVIPWFTNMTIGVLNLQVLGMAISEEHIHNLELVQELLDRPVGAIITPGMVAKLVTHPRGFFQYSRGERVLFCTGYDTVPRRYIDALLDALEGAYLSKIVLADGYRESCEIRQVLKWM